MNKLIIASLIPSAFALDEKVKELIKIDADKGTAGLNFSRGLDMVLNYAKDLTGVSNREATALGATGATNAITKAITQPVGAILQTVSGEIPADMDSLTNAWTGTVGGMVDSLGFLGRAKVQAIQQGETMKQALTNLTAASVAQDSEVIGGQQVSAANQQINGVINSIGQVAAGLTQGSQGSSGLIGQVLNQGTQANSGLIGQVAAGLTQVASGIPGSGGGVLNTIMGSMPMSNANGTPTSMTNNAAQTPNQMTNTQMTNTQLTPGTLINQMISTPTQITPGVPSPTQIASAGALPNIQWSNVTSQQANGQQIALNTPNTPSSPTSFNTTTFGTIPNILSPIDTPVVDAVAADARGILQNAVGDNPSPLGNAINNLAENVNYMTTTNIGLPLTQLLPAGLPMAQANGGTARQAESKLSAIMAEGLESVIQGKAAFEPAIAKWMDKTRQKKLNGTTEAPIETTEQPNNEDLRVEQAVLGIKGEGSEVNLDDDISVPSDPYADLTSAPSAEPFLRTATTPDPSANSTDLIGMSNSIPSDPFGDLDNTPTSTSSDSTPTSTSSDSSESSTNLDIPSVFSSSDSQPPSSNLFDIDSMNQALNESSNSMNKTKLSSSSESRQSMPPGGSTSPTEESTIQDKSTMEKDLDGERTPEPISTLTLESDLNSPSTSTTTLDSPTTTTLTLKSDLNSPSTSTTTLDPTDSPTNSQLNVSPSEDPVDPNAAPITLVSPPREPSQEIAQDNAWLPEFEMKPLEKTESKSDKSNRKTTKDASRSAKGEEESLLSPPDLPDPESVDYDSFAFQIEEVKNQVNAAQEKTRRSDNDDAFDDLIETMDQALEVAGKRRLQERETTTTAPTGELDSLDLVQETNDDDVSQELSELEEDRIKLTTTSSTSTPLTDSNSINDVPNSSDDSSTSSSPSTFMKPDNLDNLKTMVDDALFLVTSSAQSMMQFVDQVYTARGALVPFLGDDYTDDLLRVVLESVLQFAGKLREQEMKDKQPTGAYFAVGDEVLDRFVDLMPEWLAKVAEGHEGLKTALLNPGKLAEEIKMK